MRAYGEVLSVHPLWVRERETLPAVDATNVPPQQTSKQPKLQRPSPAALVGSKKSHKIQTNKRPSRLLRGSTRFAKAKDDPWFVVVAVCMPKSSSLAAACPLLVEPMPVRLSSNFTAQCKPHDHLGSPSKQCMKTRQSSPLILGKELAVTRILYITVGRQFPDFSQDDRWIAPTTFLLPQQQQTLPLPKVFPHIQNTSHNFLASFPDQSCQSP